MKKGMFWLLASVTIPVALLLLISAMTKENESVRHVVVFKYKPNATPAQIKEVTDAFRKLTKDIDGITGFEHGVNNSPEKKELRVYPRVYAYL